MSEDLKTKVMAAIAAAAITASEEMFVPKSSYIAISRPEREVGMEVTKFIVKPLNTIYSQTLFRKLLGTCHQKCGEIGQKIQSHDLVVQSNIEKNQVFKAEKFTTISVNSPHLYK